MKITMQELLKDLSDNLDYEIFFHIYNEYGLPKPNTLEQLKTVINGVLEDLEYDQEVFDGDTELDKEFFAMGLKDIKKNKEYQEFLKNGNQKELEKEFVEFMNKLEKGEK